MNFYDKHCEPETICHNCRNLEGGRGFRVSLKEFFSDLKEVDFACPKNHPWGYRQKSTPGQSQARIPNHAEIKQNYATIRAEIIAAPAEGLWADLKDELRLTESAIELHPEHDECWRNKQRVRIIGFYETVKRKTGK